MATILTDIQYDANDIHIRSRLTQNVSIARFLKYAGGSSYLKGLSLSDRQQLARNLYMQAVVVETIQNTPMFNGFRLEITNGVYKSALASDPTIPYTPTINSEREAGQIIGYSLINEYGQADIAANYELAVWLKDNTLTQKVILDYDTYDTRGIMNVSVLVQMPSMPASFQASFGNSVETWFNNVIQSSSDLIELRLLT